MNSEIFSIGVDGIDADVIVKKIRERVSQKMSEGVYNDPAVSRAERNNLQNIADEEEFLALFLQNLRETATIDINDFEIAEKRKSLAPVLVPFKKFIWKLLRFYTFRLWSQQNQVNGILLAAMEGIHGSSRKKIAELERRIQEMEKERNI